MKGNIMDKRKRNTRAAIRFIKSAIDAEKELAIEFLSLQDDIIWC